MLPQTNRLLQVQGIDYLCKECVVGDTAEEVPLGHVLGHDLGDKLVEKHLQSLLELVGGSRIHRDWLELL